MSRMGDLAATDVYNAFDVPLEQTYDRRLDQTWPGQLVQDAMGAVLAPGRVLQSTEPITTEQMIKPAMDLAGLVTGGSYAAPAQRGASGAGIRAYHSSPHDFERFDLSKIGTGEGAQVYGHGLYFAESPAVSGQGGEYWRQFTNKFGPAERSAAAYLEDAGFDRVRAAEVLRKSLADPDTALKPSTLANVQRFRSEALKLLESDKPIGPRTYEVSINADPAHMLDWDKVLREQPAKVVSALGDKLAAQKARGEVMMPSYLKQFEAGDLPGEAVYGGFGRGTKESATQALHEAGIPGIKYLDQGSRVSAMGDTADFIKKYGSRDAAIDAVKRRSEIVSESDRPRWLGYLKQLQTPQTSNYVVFDPGIVDIMKKYGIVGAAPVGMGALAAQDRYQQ